MKERPVKRAKLDVAPPPPRYAVQSFAPLRRRLGVTAMVMSLIEIYRQLTGLSLTLAGWAAPFSTRRVDFLSIKLGIRVCRDICGLSNRSSSPHDLLLASLPSGFDNNCFTNFALSGDSFERVLNEIGILVRRDSAVKLIDGLAGESPASAGCPVGTVVISGDGAGDQTVGSPDVKVFDGWTQVWSAPTGGQAKQQVVAQANRSQVSKTHPHQDRSVRIKGMLKL